MFITSHIDSTLWFNCAFKYRYLNVFVISSLHCFKAEGHFEFLFLTIKFNGLKE